MELGVVLLSMLAVWRATHMLQDENGPSGIFARLQAWAAKQPNVIGGINEGFFCFYCLSIWISLPAALVLGGSLFEILILWFAISAGAIFINSISEKLNS